MLRTKLKEEGTMVAEILAGQNHINYNFDSRCCIYYCEGAAAGQTERAIESCWLPLNRR
jgi:hypothetical protein